MTLRLVELLKRRLLQNILALYVVKAVNQLLPLGVLPLLSRVLGPEEWGRVAIAQNLAIWGIVAVQYGFQMSGTRAIAEARDRPARIGEILADILAAQGLLAALFLAVVATLHLSVPTFQAMPLLLSCAVVYAVVHALAPLWYFVGQERVMFVAGIDCVVRLGSLVGVLMLVRGPSDGWLVLAIYALASALSTGALFALALRETPLPRPSLRGVRETLRDGTSLGLLAIVASGTTAGSAVLLGMLLPPAQVAYFVAAEKLTRPVAYLLDPVNTALMPRLSHLVGTARDRARRLARISLLSMVAIGTLLAIVVAVGAPRFVPLVFGAGYETVVPVTRLMAVVIPLIVANAALAGQWLIPHGLDRWLTTCVVVSALFHFGAAVMVVPQFGAFGMAWAVVGSQALLLLSLAAVLHRHGLIRGLP